MATQRSNFSRSSETSSARPRREDTFQKSDDEYMAMIEQYKGSPYYDAMKNNPWLYGSNKKFSPNLGQQILGWFGDNSAEDAYYADLLNKRNQEFQKQLSLHNEYIQNLPNQQVAMQQAAGVNTDLNGISQTPIPENDQAIAPFDMGNQYDFGKVINVASTVIGSALSFYNSLQGVKSLALDNAMKEFTLNDTLRGFAWNVIKEGTSEYLNNPLSKSPGSEVDVQAILENGEFIDPIVKTFRDRVDRMPFSRRQKRALHGIFDDLVYAKDSDGNKAFSSQYEKLVHNLTSEVMQSRNSVAKSSSLPGSDSSSQAALRFMSLKVYKPLVDLQIDVDKQVLNMQLAEAKQNTAYHNSVDGALRGSAENARNQMTVDMLDIKNNVLSTFTRINKEITGSKELSPAWKIALEAGVSSAEVLLMNKLAIN